jgi:transposase-like protein
MIEFLSRRPDPEQGEAEADRRRDSPSGEHFRADGDSTEVKARRTKRRFSAGAKRRILEAADACTKHGELGALLRREGLYSSQLAKWRLLREQGGQSALTEKKRGRKPTANPLEAKLAASERRVAALERKLQEAAEIIDVQKKVAALLGNTIVLPPHLEKI